MSGRLPDPDPSTQGPQGDGFVATYGLDDSGQSIEIIADPGTGIASPAHGMASTMLYSGGPQKCIDADHSPVLDGLFTLRQDHDLQAELRRIAETEPVPGELVWLICTMTYDGDRDLPLAEEDWRYLADWSDGGWLYTVRASSALQRESAIATLAELSASQATPDAGHETG